jgi:hypothetical protein
VNNILQQAQHLHTNKHNMLNMKKLILSLFIFSTTVSLQLHAQNVDSMQHRLDTTTNLCAKAELYTNIAANLIQFNQPQTRNISNADASKAVDYVLKAIHLNNKYNDTLAIRNNFDCLSQAYFLQKKYTQAKWFSLQSAQISRDRRDVPFIIKSLMQLVTIKVALKEYTLAQKDLNEAIVLAQYSNNVPKQIEVEKTLADLYSKEGKLKESVKLVEHYSLLSENLQKANLKKYYAVQKVKTRKRILLNEPRQITDLQDSQDENTDIKAETDKTVLAVNN